MNFKTSFLFFTLFFSQIAWGLETVSYVDLERYQGTWYEIARFDHSFQRGCTQTSAEYKLKKNNQVSVLNRCLETKKNGEQKWKDAKGNAWVADETTNAKLKVQFFLKWVKIPLFAGDYWIIELGEDYDYVVISEPKQKYLWILSRAGKMSEDQYNDITERLTNLGFDTKKLIVESSRITQ
jgi:apolipoprotein D and lipocalin family protein